MSLHAVGERKRGTIGWVRDRKTNIQLLKFCDHFQISFCENYGSDSLFDSLSYVHAPKRNRNREGNQMFHHLIEFYNEVV